MMPFVQLPAAWQEYDDAIRHYASILPELALDFADAVTHSRQLICADPQLFRVRKLNIRRVNLGPQFEEWYVAYMLAQEQVVIVAIGHAKRRPFYFRRRLDEVRKVF